MIVDPDFFEHWRTRLLVDLLDSDEMAPMYVMRIWAHCQTRKTVRFETMSANGIKALCRFSGDASKLEAALIEAEFLVREGSAITVPKWAEHNAKLIANWTNGATGGRPPKAKEEPAQKPVETQPEPTVTQQEPIRSREELEQEKPKGKVKSKASAAPSFDPMPDLLARGVQEQTAKDWLAIRKAKRAVLTVTALADIIAEADKAGMSLERALVTACRRGWAGFNASWLQNDDAQVRASPQKPDNFNLQNVDRSGDEALAEASRRKHGIVIDPNEEYQF